MSNVRRTASGLYIRDEPHLGLLVYSPYSGLIFAVERSHVPEVLQWLDGKFDSPRAPQIAAALGHGWHTNGMRFVVPVPHLLPKPGDWPHVGVTKYPILLNWFITGQCPLDCQYCYAEDLMRGRRPEPSGSEITERATRVLALSPLVVVLTGGDPLFGGNFRFAVEALAGKTGILVDTSGYTLNDRHITMMKEYHVCARISIDAERPRIHNLLRPVYPMYPQLKTTLGPSYDRALQAIVRLKEAGVPVAIQTVATKKNVNELLAFGDKLASLGVEHWRIFKVSPSNAKMPNYRKLVGMEKDSGETLVRKPVTDPYGHHFREIAAAAKSRWAGRMNVQLTSNDSPNAIIMLEPGGTFVTESNVPGGGKVLVDGDFPETPRVDILPTRVNMAAHVERYLNITSQRYW